jgi:hypothetical protein
MKDDLPIVANDHDSSGKLIVRDRVVHQRIDQCVGGREAGVGGIRWRGWSDALRRARAHASNERSDREEARDATHAATALSR